MKFPIYDGKVIKFHGSKPPTNKFPWQVSWNGGNPKSWLQPCHGDAYRKRTHIFHESMNSGASPRFGFDDSAVLCFPYIGSKYFHEFQKYVDQIFQYWTHFQYVIYAYSTHIPLNIHVFNEFHFLSHNFNVFSFNRFNLLGSAERAVRSGIPWRRCICGTGAPRNRRWVL